MVRDLFLELVTVLVFKNFNYYSIKDKKMKFFRSILKFTLACSWVLLAADFSRSQTGNQSDVSGPNPNDTPPVSQSPTNTNTNPPQTSPPTNNNQPDSNGGQNTNNQANNGNGNNNNVNNNLTQNPSNNSGSGSTPSTGTNTANGSGSTPSTGTNTANGSGSTPSTGTNTANSGSGSTPSTGTNTANGSGTTPSTGTNTANSGSGTTPSTGTNTANGSGTTPSTGTNTANSGSGTTPSTGTNTANGSGSTPSTGTNTANGSGSTPSTGTNTANGSGTTPSTGTNTANGTGTTPSTGTNTANSGSGSTPSTGTNTANSGSGSTPSTGTNTANGSGSTPSTGTNTANGSGSTPSTGTNTANSGSGTTPSTGTNTANGSGTTPSTGTNTANGSGSTPSTGTNTANGSGSTPSTGTNTANSGSGTTPSTGTNTANSGSGTTPSTGTNTANSGSGSSSPNVKNTANNSSGQNSNSGTNNNNVAGKTPTSNTTANNNNSGGNGNSSGQGSATTAAKPATTVSPNSQNTKEQSSDSQAKNPQDPKEKTENNQQQEEKKDAQAQNDKKKDDNQQQKASGNGQNNNSIDRVAYEAQIQQAGSNAAMEMQEEFQATELMGSANLELYGKAPSVQEISKRLGELWRQTGKKPVFINVSVQSNRLETFAVLPTLPDTAKNGDRLVASTNPVQAVETTAVRQTIGNISRQQVLDTAKQFSQEISDPARIKDSSYMQSSQQLYKWIVAPIEAQLKAANADILVFSMDSGLRLLPIAALNDGKQFLIEKYAVALVPSFGLTDTRYVNISKSSILAMGASQFQDQISLPTIPIELQNITKNPRSGDVFLNEQFTIENFVAQNSSQKHYGIIHLGTHAEFLPGDAQDSYIQFYDGKLRMPQLRKLSNEFGWNSAKTAPVELLVLSACQTALGNEKAELGFAGLAVQAGVKSALASLWQVSDLGTLGLMSEFYQDLSEAPIKAEALRNAQLAMLKGKVRIENGKLFLSDGETETLPQGIPQGNVLMSHPYFWSPFTLIGNWN
jgi:CHAT domain-containing protein